MQCIQKIWGLRYRLFVSKTTVVDKLKLDKNTFCSLHYHKNKWNQFYVISGLLMIQTDYGEIIIGSGETFTVQPDLKHRFVAMEESEIIEISYVINGEIEEEDIIRESQGGKIINGNEILEKDLKNV